MAVFNFKPALRGHSANKQTPLHAMRRPPSVPVVRVVPSSGNGRFDVERVRKIMKHPSGVRFRGSGSTEWPFDTFTKKRLAEGVIKLAERS